MLHTDESFAKRTGESIKKENIVGWIIHCGCMFPLSKLFLPSSTAHLNVIIKNTKQFNNAVK